MLLFSSVFVVRLVNAVHRHVVRIQLAAVGQFIWLQVLGGKRNCCLFEKETVGVVATTLFNERRKKAKKPHRLPHAKHAGFY